MDCRFIMEDNKLKKYIGVESVVQIPEGVTEIGSEAFQECLSVIEVIMPDSVKVIETNAFEGCKQLKKVHFSNQLTTIKYGSFCECSSLKEIQLPDTMKSIADGAFAGCSNLSYFSCEAKDCHYGGNPFGNIEYPSSKKLFDDDGFIIFNGIVFAYRGEATTVIVPDGVTSINAFAFDAVGHFGDTLAKIKKIILPQSVKYVGTCAFRGCYNLKNVEMPENITFGNFVFQGCDGMVNSEGMLIAGGTLHSYEGISEEVKVPDGVNCIANGAFSGSSYTGKKSNRKVKKVILPEGLKTIGNAAFEECVALEEIQLPKSLTFIGANAFQECKKLTSVEVPVHVEVGDMAFWGCEKLADENGFVIFKDFLFHYLGNERDVIVPEHVRAIGTNAFLESNITTINLPERLEDLGSAFTRCTTLKQVNLPKSLTEIKGFTFQQCIALEEIVIPEQVSKIGYSAFDECTSLQRVCMPEKIELIESDAFAKCYKLSEVLFDNRDCIVDNYAFENCSGLVDEKGMAIVGGTLLYYKGTERQVQVPSHVKRIGKKAFDHAENLKKVIACEGVEVIEEDAFYFCDKLEKIHLPSTLKYMSADSFTCCPKLDHIFVDDGNPYYASDDGILYNSDKTQILLCLKKVPITEFVVGDQITAIASKAFFYSGSPERVVIPANVKFIGDQAFKGEAYWHLKGITKEIEVEIGAGSEGVGFNIFDFPKGEEPLVFPKLPVDFLSENDLQVRLALGYLENPEKYSEEYAAGYKHYADSKKKTLLKKATSLKLKKAMEYYGESEESLAAKKEKKTKETKITEPEKVKLLEEAVLTGDVTKVKAVIDTYKKFKFMSRALGLACLYSNVEMVKTLLELGATFKYRHNEAVAKSYGAGYNNYYSSYPAQYSWMVSATAIDPFLQSVGANASKLNFGNLPETDAPWADEETRADIAEFLVQQPCDFDKEGALFYALIWGCMPVAKRLLACGVKIKYKMLQPFYETAVSLSRTEILSCLSQQKPALCADTLETFVGYLKEKNKQIIFTPKIFEEKGTSLLAAEPLKIILRDTDTSKLKPTKIFEQVLEHDDAAALSVLVDFGWLKTIAQREKLIKYAMENQKPQALAWLIDYKNRTADFAAEQAKEEAKTLRELMEKPDSVSALKKIWSYKKLEDGTLKITSYKGTETEVVVPAAIGKSKVSTIGEYAFGYDRFGKEPANIETRKGLTSVVVPEGIVTICEEAFDNCKKLQSVSLPSTLKTIGANAFHYCDLSELTISPNTTDIGDGAFDGCDKLCKDGFLIINNVLYACIVKAEKVEIPEGVVAIASGAFNFGGDINILRIQGKIKEVVLPNTVERIEAHGFFQSKIERIQLPPSVKYIGENAFGGCKNLNEVILNEGLQTIGYRAFAYTDFHEIVIPRTVKTLDYGVFEYCYRLHDIYIPGSVKKIGNRCFGWNRDARFIHTTKGSFADTYAKESQDNLIPVYDYE